MIFVVDAIARRSCARFAQRTRPVRASMTIAAGELTVTALCTTAGPNTSRSSFRRGGREERRSTLALALG
jgi:hypothetical protein